MIQIGEKADEGLGRGRDAGNRQEGPQRKAARRLPARLKGADLVFVTAGMGGGTGYGRGPRCWWKSRAIWAFWTIAVVTKPFAFEGKTRMRKAESGIDELKQRVDTLVVIPERRLFSGLPEGNELQGRVQLLRMTCFVRAFRAFPSDLISQDGYH